MYPVSPAVPNSERRKLVTWRFYNKDAKRLINIKSPFFHTKLDGKEFQSGSSDGCWSWIDKRMGEARQERYSQIKGMTSVNK